MFFLILFTIVAAPVIKGEKQVGDAITVHTLFQGLAACSENNADFGSVSYDFGFLNYDHPVIAQIRAYAKRTGNVYPVYDLTPEYGEVGKRMFRDVVLTFPADLAGRTVAVADSLFGILATPFLHKPQASKKYSGDVMFHEIELFLGRFFQRYGLASAIVAMALLGAQSFRMFFFVLFLWGYFSAYPSTLFEFRHYFYLAFIPCFFSGMLLAILWRGITKELFDADQSLGKIWHGAIKPTLRGIVILQVPTLLVGTALIGLRGFQLIRWNRLLALYDQAELAPVAVIETEKDGKVLLALERPVPVLLGKTIPLPEYEVAPAYMALRFRAADRTISFQIINNNPIFSRQSTVVLRNGGTYFFPVYDYTFDPAFTLLGIEMNTEDRAYLDGLYRVDNPDKFRLWPFVFVPGMREAFAFYKSGRLDRCFSALWAEIQAGFGLSPHRGLHAYKRLIPRHPFHTFFLERALVYAQQAKDSEQESGVWETAGAFMPELREKAARYLAERAEGFLNENEFDQAIRYYEKSIAVTPSAVDLKMSLAHVYEL